MKSWNIRCAIYTCFTTTETLSLGLEMGCGYYVSRNKEATLCRLWPFSVFGARDPNSGTKIMHVQILSLGWQFNFNMINNYLILFKIWWIINKIYILSNTTWYPPKLNMECIFILYKYIYIIFRTFLIQYDNIDIKYIFIILSFNINIHTLNIYINYFIFY